METTTRLTARYAETDQMGIIHHSNYAVWFEAARTEFFKQLGISYKDIENRGVILPLYEMNCKFKSPARYEDELEVKTMLISLTKVRITFSYTITNVFSQKVLAAGETKHAWTNKSLKPVNAESELPEVYSLLKKIVGK